MNKKKGWIILVILALVIVICFIEGEVYKYVALTYWVAAIVEISLFLIGVVVGRASKSKVGIFAGI